MWPAGLFGSLVNPVAANAWLMKWAVLIRQAEAQIEIALGLLSVFFLVLK